MHMLQSHNIVAYRSVAKQWLCKQRPLLRNARQHTCTQQQDGVMQPGSKQRISKHANDNRGIVKNGVFYSVRAKWL
jgi:hypothetical protein